jgi:hypothetical protein
LKNIQYGGYAGASTDGVSFIVFVEFSKERFRTLVGQEIRLNIIVPNDSKQKMTFKLVTRMDFEDGSICHFGTSEELTTEEIKHIKEWCETNNIVKESERIRLEYNKEMDNFFFWGDKLTESFDEILNGSFNNTEAKREELNEIELQMKEARKRAAALEDIQYN